MNGEDLMVAYWMFKDWLKRVFGGGIHFSTDEVFGNHAPGHYEEDEK